MNATAAKPSSSRVFVPIVRTFAPFVAGMGHMSYRHFAAYNVVGALLWVLLFTYAGYLFGDLPIVQENLKLLIVAIIVPVGTARRYRSDSPPPGGGKSRLNKPLAAFSPGVAMTSGAQSVSGSTTFFIPCYGML